MGNVGITENLVKVGCGLADKYTAQAAECEAANKGSGLSCRCPVQHAWERGETQSSRGRGNCTTTAFGSRAALRRAGHSSRGKDKERNLISPSWAAKAQGEMQ